jgi:hypothetical protein
MFKGSFLFSLLAVLCIACSPGSDPGSGGDGDGGDGDGGGDPPDTSGPNTDIHYPSIGAYTPQSQVTVRGRSEDPSGVLLVSANGLVASTTDDYDTWQVPGVMVAGTGEMEVYSEDLVGNFSTELQTIDAGSRRMLSPTQMAYDAGRSRVLVMDQIWGAILSLDPDSGDAEVLAPHSNATLTPPDELAFSAGSDQLLALEGASQQVVGFHPESGVATILSGPGVGGGPIFSAGVALTPGSGSSAYLIDTNHNFSGHGVISIDLSTGDRSLLSLDGLSPGLNLIQPVDMVFDSAGARLLVLDLGWNGIVSVSLDTGERGMVAESALSTEEFGWGDPCDIQLGSNAESIWLLDAQESKIWDVDLAGGSSYVLSDAADGALALNPVGIVLESQNTLLALQPSWPALVRVDLTTGARVISAETRVAPGPGWIAGGRAGVSGSRDELYITDSTCERLHTISLADGTRVALADDGEYGALVSGVVLDEQTLLVLAVEPGQEALYSYDIETGERQILSGQGVGWGIQLANAIEVTVDAASNKAYVLEYDALDQNQTGIVTVDLSSGGRSVLTGGTTGTGVPLRRPTSIVWDAEGDRAIVTDPGLNAVLAVYQDGVRTMLSGLPVGSVNSVVMDAPAGRVIVASSSGRIFSCRLGDGAVQEIYNMSSGLPGPPPGDVLLVGICYERALLYALSDSYQGILAIDLANQEHVLMSLGGE